MQILLQRLAHAILRREALLRLRHRTVLPPRKLGHRVGQDRLSRFGEAERTGEAEDGDAVLGRDHGAGRVRAAVAEALDAVDDGDVGVPEGEEVAVEGVEALKYRFVRFCER